jgi:hypothetical protein
MRQVLGCTLAVLIGLGVSSCGSSTEIPTVAEDPWAPPEAPAEDAGTDTDELKPPCGNGGICDPQDLGGETCPGLGMGDGTLACDPVTCTYDTSMCEGSTGTGNGGNGSTGMGNNGAAGMGADQPPFFGGGNNGGAGDSGNGNGQGGDGNTPQLFGAGFFGGDADGGTAFFGGGFFGGSDGDGGTGFFGGGFFGGNSFGGGNNNNGGGDEGDQDTMDAGI